MRKSQIQKLQRSLEWLKTVADIDDDYVKRWSPAEWGAWQAAMLADPQGNNPSVPAWMNPIIHGKWHNDFSLPSPQVGQLWPTAHPWFLEEFRRADFELKISEPVEDEFPLLSQVEAVHDAAVMRDWTTLMLLVIEPTPQPKVVVGAVEAFYILAPSSDSDAVVELMQAHDLPCVTTHLAGPMRTGRDLLESADIAVPEFDYVVWASEWMYADNPRVKGEW